MGYRKERLESLIEQLLAEEILRNIEDERGLITITSVVIDMENDVAEISVSVYPDEVREGVVRRLNREAPDLAYKLLKKMKIKKVPFLKFV